MQNPKEQLKAYLDRVTIETWDLNSNLSVISSLRKLNDSKKRNAYNTVPEFFAFVHKSSLTHLVLTLDRFFESPKEVSRECNVCNNTVSESSYGDRSLIWYLNQLSTHSSSFTKPHKFNQQEIDEQLSWIEVNKESIRKIGTYRDKWFAHRDRKYFDNPQIIWKENPLLFEDLENLVNLVNKIISKSHGKFRDADVSWFAEHMIGLDRIFNMMAFAREAIPKVAEYEIRERKVVEFIRSKCGEEAKKEFIKNYSI